MNQKYEKITEDIIGSAVDIELKIAVEYNAKDEAQLLDQLKSNSKRFIYQKPYFIRGLKKI